MTSSLPPVLSLPPLPIALRIIRELSDQQLSALARHMQEPSPFTLDNAKRSSLRKELGQTDLDIDQLVDSLELLYEAVHHGTHGGTQPPDTLEDTLRRFGLWSYLGDDPNITVQRLDRLLKQNQYVEREHKRLRLQEGLLENAVSFATLVDLRPNFSKKRDAIEEFVVVTLLELTTQKADGTEKSYVFQMTESNINALRKTLDDAAVKLSFLRKLELMAKPSIF